MDPARNMLSYNGLEKLFFALKVQKKCAFGNPCTRCYLFSAGRCKTFFNKQFQRCIQQFAWACFFAPLAFDGEYSILWAE